MYMLIHSQTQIPPESSIFILHTFWHLQGCVLRAGVCMLRRCDVKKNVMICHFKYHRALMIAFNLKVLQQRESVTRNENESERE